MSTTRAILFFLITLSPLALEARLPTGGPDCGDTPCPVPAASSQSVKVEQTVNAETKPDDFEREHQVLFSWSLDNFGRYVRTGGHLRFTFALTKRYGLGLQTGLISVPPDTEVPFNLVNGWEFRTRNERAGLIFNFVTGVSLAWDAHADRWEGGTSVTTPIWNLLLELGANVKINDIVGIAVLAHGGVGIVNFFVPKPVFGGRVGPVFYF